MQLLKGTNNTGKILSIALSENANHLVHTADNDLISIGALITNDSEAIESMLPHGVTKVSLEPPESAERTFL